MKLRVCLHLVWFGLVIYLPLYAFCGFYVAKADSNLYNKASQIILVRNENRTALTLYADYQGDPKEFALVIPVPQLLKREQINVADRAIVERVDAFSAPRLVESFDPDPCEPIQVLRGALMQATDSGASGASDKSLGVTIEAQYTVGEYDILILDAKESDGLETWLKQKEYKIPNGAAQALKPYIGQKMKFFVAKVNLKEHTKLGYHYLRPIQFAFESEKFMLPIRLGMLNSDGSQDMLVFLITKQGRVESTNYRTVKLPTDLDLPIFVKYKFPDFYKAMFENSYQKENKKVLFTEYAWNMASCDPCAADPLTPEELRKIGVFWAESEKQKSNSSLTQPASAFITRLHIRYEKSNFPEDLMFQETGDTSSFQARYVLRHPWQKKERSCAQEEPYTKSLETRRQKEVQNLARLTGWNLEDIHKQVSEENKSREPGSSTDPKWYDKIFK